MNNSSPYARTLERLLSSESTPKLGLARMQALLHAMGNPERHFESIHVAGTNGKGSTSALTESLLRQKLDKVGLFTSPHLLCTRERIQINRELVSEALFCEAAACAFKAARQTGEKPTFFEYTTAMAFWVFATQKVDIAVIEVGLGGRLDATNVIHPKACIITHLALDHCEFLGNTLSDIAKEKAGIIKRGVPVITGWQNEDAMDILRAKAQLEEAPFLETVEPSLFDLGLAGSHQSQNAALAVSAVQAADVTLSESQVQNALLNTRWPCRLERVHSDPPVLIDGAHNPDGMRALVDSLSESNEPLVFVLGTTIGHDANAMAQELLPLKERIGHIFVTKSRSPRAEEPAKLADVLRMLGPCTETDSVKAAMTAARQLAASALTIVAGSLYVAGEARSLFFEMPIDPELPIY